MSVDKKWHIRIVFIEKCTDLSLFSVIFEINLDLVFHLMKNSTKIFGLRNSVWREVTSRQTDLFPKSG